MLLIAAAVIYAPAPTSAKGGGPCDRVAKRGASPVKFVHSLRRGTTGCLRGRTYRAGRAVRFVRPNVTLRSRPGARATVVGRIWVTRRGRGVTVRNLKLIGTNRDRSPSPTVNADGVTFRKNNITNRHTGICFVLGHYRYGRADRTVIRDNRIHDCGRLPATNHDHGIYVAHARRSVIRDNRIYGNADRGVQLYPNADRTLIIGNVISGNGQGVIFSSAGRSTSENNVVTRNVIKNSRIRFNVEASWRQGPVGRGNVVRGNCIYGGVRGAVKGGIQLPALGFKALRNVTREGRCKLGLGGRR